MGQCLSLLPWFSPEAQPPSQPSISHPNSDTPQYPHVIKHAYVSKMPDGDTLVCSYRHPDGTTATVRVRVKAIDCPETAQNFGPEAKQIGQALLLHKTVTLHPYEIDRYGRLVADVVTHTGINYAQYMLRKGAAWHYKAYDSRPELARLEADAQKSRVGLWSYPRPLAPWEYRRRKRRRQEKK